MLKPPNRVPTLTHSCTKAQYFIVTRVSGSGFMHASLQTVLKHPLEN